MSIEHWIMVYLFLNGVLCYQLDGDSWQDKGWWDWIEGAITALLGIPLGIFVLAQEGAVRTIGWLDGLVQFRTYWYYAFNRKRLVTPNKDLLLAMYKKGLRLKSSNSITDRLWRHAQGLIHKVNNYTPEK